MVAFEPDPAKLPEPPLRRWMCPSAPNAAGDCDCEGESVCGGALVAFEGGNAPDELDDISRGRPLCKPDKLAHQQRIYSQ